jgi:hypothetical protein
VVVYPVVALAVALLALLVLVVGLRLLLGRRWLLAWLRGCAGLLLLAVAAVALLAAWDLYGYRQLLVEKPIATLAFTGDGDHHYNVVLIDEGGGEQRHSLKGDMWQLDVRLLKWHDGLARLGLKPGYRLDRLAGRYISLEDEQRLPRTVVGLDQRQSAIDSWRWLRQLDAHISLVDAEYGSATYLPMADGALYSVALGPSGLVARPLNDRAELAIEQWQ